MNERDLTPEQLSEQSVRNRLIEQRGFLRLARFRGPINDDRELKDQLLKNERIVVDCEWMFTMVEVANRGDITFKTVDTIFKAVDEHRQIERDSSNS